MCLQSETPQCSHDQLWTGKSYENLSNLYYHTLMFTAHLRTVLKIGMALCICFHSNLLQKVDFIDAFSLPNGYEVIKVDPLNNIFKGLASSFS